jgi:hypothetical protein
MAFKTTLFKLLDVPYGAYTVDNREIADFTWLHCSLVRSGHSGHDWWEFRDQEVKIDGNGAFQVLTQPNGRAPAVTVKMVATIRTNRPITASDLNPSPELSGEELDVDVIDVAGLDEVHAAGFSKPWLVQSANGAFIEFDTEDEARTFQRGWRALHGLNAMTGQNEGG